MINLLLKDLRPGMVTAQSICNQNGDVVLKRGEPLTDANIDKLVEIGLPDICVTSVNTGASIMPPSDILAEKTRADAIHKVYGTFRALEETGELDPAVLTPTAEAILTEALDNRENLVQLTDIRMHDDYTFAHSVNVALLSAILGSLCDLTGAELITLVMGGLLHDIGKLIIPNEILTKPEQLSKRELYIVQMHPDAGRVKLGTLSAPFAPMLATIAGQHHEHMDGRGYPDHISGDQIHRFSRIVAIADVYDALTSNRVYKPAYRPHIAYKIMTKCSPGHFDERLLKLFFDNVAVYPVGTVLKTSMGYAIVKKVEFGRTLTPTVCVFGDLAGERLDHPFDVDLSKCAPDVIINALEELELMPLLFRMRVDPTQYLKDN